MLRPRTRAAAAWLVRGVSWRLLRAVQTDDERRVEDWYALDREGDLRLRYPLNDDSVVLDVGGYMGQWASDIFSMYRCTVHVYEPVPVFAQHIEERFAANPSIVVHPEGIASSTREETLYLDGNASSMAAFKQRHGRTRTIVRMLSATEVIAGLGTHVDLLGMNIEGAEYEVLECLLDGGYLDRIGHLQVQFHSFVPDAEGRRAAIQSRLRDTHHLSYCVPFVWESWAPGRPPADAVLPTDR